ncbi:MAG: hypothetical protein ACK46A_07100, partial [Akkermansiaceae bacterium]
SDPFSNRPVVGNFQELRADLKRSEASFNPQILRKRLKIQYWGIEPQMNTDGRRLKSQGLFENSIFPASVCILYLRSSVFICVHLRLKILLVL